MAALPAASWFPALLRRPREVLPQENRQAQRSLPHTVVRNDGTLTTLTELKRDVRTMAGTPKGRRAVLMVDQVHSMGVLAELHISVDQHPVAPPNGRSNANGA